MLKKQLQLLFLIFIIGFLIDYSLIHLFYAQHYVREPLIISEKSLEKFSKLDITGEQLLRIKDYCIKNNLDFTQYLSNYMEAHDFAAIEYENEELGLSEYQTKEGNELRHLYYMVFNDIQCFPLAIETVEDLNRYTYADSFLAPRSYGGERKHLGTDIMDSKNESGYFKIVSMTDGIVENMGWLELGGYRVGIRSSSGAYIYYAHLDSYAQGLKEGDSINAGDLLGYMGCTGYGPEGTVGQFDVHLHLGICINVNSKEIWINPYAILQMFDQKITLEDYDLTEYYEQ